MPFGEKETKRAPLKRGATRQRYTTDEGTPEEGRTGALSHKRGVEL